MIQKIDMKLDETETIISYSQYNIGPWAEVYTTDKLVMKRYSKFCKEHPDRARLVKEDKYSMTFSVDPKCASLYPKAPRRVILTEEQKEQRRQHIARVNAQKQS